MASQLVVITLSLLALLTASSCVGREFIVGDGGGWVERPGHESFNDWAVRQRFHINDTLEFKYNKMADPAVLLVNQSQYDACNTSQPLRRLDGGDSRFVLNNPGYYYFIDADPNRCRQGERLIVAVEHLHNNPSSKSSEAVALKKAGGALALACLVAGGTAILV